jgi:hypothetical protein
MKHADGFAVQRLELIAPEPLVLPDGLEQALGRGVIPLVEERDSAALQAPPGVEVVRKRQHLGDGIAPMPPQCQGVF